MQRVFRVVDTKELQPIGLKTTQGFNHSVRDNGVITPILVAEVPDADGVIRLEIIDGNRRVRAAHQAGIDRVPAVVLRETAAEERARLTLICNHLRSLNFFTESRAALALADDDHALEREARLMGLSVSKVLGMVQKLERMPEPVRQAMWEERVQVSSATDIAGFPPPLQAEVVAKLAERGWLDTRTVIAMKADWEARHGAINPRSGSRARRQGPPLAPPQWEDAAPVPFDNGAGPMRAGGWQVRPVEHPGALEATTARSASSATATAGRPLSPAMPAATPNPDADQHEDSAGRLPKPEGQIGEVEAFVKVLDATLRDLAGEGRALGISRTVWVDRTMRAWDRTEG
jgi:ParB/RepB/Spo0J family partition protein